LGHVSFSQGVVEQESHYRMASRALHSHQNQRASLAPLDYFSCRPGNFAFSQFCGTHSKLFRLESFRAQRNPQPYANCVCELLKLS